MWENIPEPVRNRFVHISLSPDSTDSWTSHLTLNLHAVIPAMFLLVRNRSGIFLIPSFPLVWNLSSNNVFIQILNDSRQAGMTFSLFSFVREMYPVILACPESFLSTYLFPKTLYYHTIIPNRNKIVGKLQEKNYWHFCCN